MKEPDWMPVIGFAVIPEVRTNKLRSNVIYASRADALAAKKRRKGKSWIVRMNCQPVK